MTWEEFMALPESEAKERLKASVDWLMKHRTVTPEGLRAERAEEQKRWMN